MSVWLTVIGMHPDGRLAEPDRARAALDAADEVIGHHDEDGVARFLRQRFDLE